MYFVDLIYERKKKSLNLVTVFFFVFFFWGGGGGGKVKSRVKSKVIHSEHDVAWFSTFHRGAACCGGRVTPHLTVDRAMLQRDRVVCGGSQAAHSPCHSRAVAIKQLHRHLQPVKSPLTTLLLSLPLLSFGDTTLCVFGPFSVPQRPELLRSTNNRSSYGA